MKQETTVHTTQAQLQHHIMFFIDLVNERLVHLKLYNVDFISYAYMRRAGWILTHTLFCICQC